jgi:formylglycine-generating enzyme required for sulfatase activity
LPEVVVVVDTDLPVPLAVSRLRVDLYGDDGVWFESADFSRPDPRDWPVSFGIYADDPDAKRARRVWVRLRGYLDGHTRDYRGENPHTWGAPDGEGTPGGAPRLVEGGADVTPASEPEPLMSVDRLVLVEIAPATKSYAPVVLRAACLGTSAVLGNDPARLVAGEAESCVDAEKTRAKVEALAGALEPPPISRAGTWLADPPCPPADGASERVCIPGGATILGTRDLISGIQLAAQPVRIVGLHRYGLDRHEVTVARFRQALAEGFVPPAMPLANEGPLGPKSTSTCTFSAAPLDREEYALNCISWSAARAFCQFAGGDLPTEAQWEHAATVAGHATKTHYPWGNDLPDCDRAAYGRIDVGKTKGECIDKGLSPPPPADSARDLSPLGVNALAAGVSEWVLDAPRPFSDPCWIDAPLVDPRCGDPAEPEAERSLRGANYLLPEMVLSTTRFADAADGTFGPVGFRCAYVEVGP